MFNYHIYDYEPFDFKAEKIPDNLYFSFGMQLERARAVLANRSNREITYIIDALDWMLKKGGELSFYESMESDAEQGYLDNRVNALRVLTGHIDLEKQDSLPSANWSEFFAALALANIVETLYLYNNPNVDKLPGTEPCTQFDILNGRYFNESALEAMDAIGTAERLKSEAELKSLLNKQGYIDRPEMEKRGKKGGNARAQTFDALRSRILQLAKEKHSNRSNREAAKRIAQEIPAEEIAKILSTDEPEITFAKWIGDDKRYRRQTND